MTTDSYSDWLNDIENSDTYHQEAAKNDFALSVYKKMRSLKLNQKELAQRLGTSNARVSKILRGDTNMTIESMVSVARSLNCQLHLHLAPSDKAVEWVPHIHAGKDRVTKKTKGNDTNDDNNTDCQILTFSRKSGFFGKSTGEIQVKNGS